jgi:hypothetical protein
VASDPLEAEAGRRALGRHAELGGGRLQQEIEAGQQRLWLNTEANPMGAVPLGPRATATTGNSAC